MPPPARRAGPQMGRGAPSYFDVVPILEQARAGQPLDPVGQIESEVRQLEASRPHDPPRPPRPARRDPRLGYAGVRAPERTEQGLRRARPAIVKHRRARHARPHASLARADTKALSVLKGVDLLA